MQKIIRNQKILSNKKMSEEDIYQQMLKLELRANTKPEMPTSQHIAAWRSYERSSLGFLGRNPHPSNMFYNILNETTKELHWSHNVLTNSDFLKSMGFTKKTAPHLALARLAEAFGYRYMRGLEAIEYGLEGSALVLFRQERLAFREDFSTRADAAHAVNIKGENPQDVLAVVELFVDELKELVPWLEQVGKSTEAGYLMNILGSIGESE